MTLPPNLFAATLEPSPGDARHQDRDELLETRPVLFVMSQVGLVLYMFCVGLEFRVDLVSRHRRRALCVSAAGIAVPFALGAALALLMLRNGGFFADQVTSMQATLFLGAAMSITAFPVLARIISERGIAGTMVGSLALAAGAVDDAAAWVLLACESHVAPKTA